MQISRISLAPFAFLVFVSPTLRAQTYERIDVNDQGQPAASMITPGTSGTDNRADMSDDGRFVIFVSSAPNLVPGDGPGKDVFLRDRQLSHTQLVTVPGATPGLSFSVNPRISADGSTITYSRGTGFNNNSPYQAFVYARVTGITTPILVPNLIGIRVDALSFDGTFAVLVARTTTNSTMQVYRLHFPTGGLVLCTRDPNGNPVGGLGQEGFSADIDQDGTHVAFTSDAAQLVAPNLNGYMDAYVYDIPGNVMLRASVDANGLEVAGPTISCSIDGDGRYVAMETLAPLISSDTNNKYDLYVRDLRLGITTLASLTTSQAPLAEGVGSRALISRDASSVALSTAENGFFPMDTFFTTDVFVRDLQAGALLPVTTGSTSMGLNFTTVLGLSGDGRQVVFFSDTPEVVGLNPKGGIFVKDLGPHCSSAGYCTSLPNSTGQAATIGAQGDASLQLNNLVISAVGMPATANAMLVSGTSAVDPGTPFGNGLMCIGGALIRHGVHVATGGVILDAQDVHSAEYMGVHPGDTRYYQVVYRDPPAGGALFNTTDAVAVTFCW